MAIAALDKFKSTAAGAVVLGRALGAKAWGTAGPLAASVAGRAARVVGRGGAPGVASHDPSAPPAASVGPPTPGPGPVAPVAPPEPSPTVAAAPAAPPTPADVARIIAPRPGRPRPAAATGTAGKSTTPSKPAKKSVPGAKLPVSRPPAGRD